MKPLDSSPIANARPVDCTAVPPSRSSPKKAFERDSYLIMLSAELCESQPCAVHPGCAVLRCRSHGTAWAVPRAGTGAVSDAPLSLAPALQAAAPPPRLFGGGWQITQGVALRPIHSTRDSRDGDARRGKKRPQKKLGTVPASTQHHMAALPRLWDDDDADAGKKAVPRGTKISAALPKVRAARRTTTNSRPMCRCHCCAHLTLPARPRSDRAGKIAWGQPRERGGVTGAVPTPPQAE